MDWEKANRIAKRVFVAIAARKKIFESGFGYGGSDKGIVVFNYNFYPMVWAYPKDGKAKMVYTIKSDYAFDDLDYTSDADLGEVGRSIRGIFRNRPATRKVRNFRVLLWNNVWENNSMKDYKGAKFLVGKTEELPVEEARAFLSSHFDIGVLEFNRVFGTEVPEDRRFSSGGMDFIVDDSSITKEQVDACMNEVKGLLPPSLAGLLLYGNVELRSKFARKGRIGDYLAKTDLVRIGQDDVFVRTMIHELGHRWHHKFCKPAQERELMQLYKRCNDPSDPLVAPRKYATKNIREFIACCFQLVYCGYGNRCEELEEKFKEIVENG